MWIPESVSKPAKVTRDRQTYINIFIGDLICRHDARHRSNPGRRIHDQDLDHAPLVVCPWSPMQSFVAHREISQTMIKSFIISLLYFYGVNDITELYRRCRCPLQFGRHGLYILDYRRRKRRRTIVINPSSYTDNTQYPKSLSQCRGPICSRLLLSAFSSIFLYPSQLHLRNIPLRYCLALKMTLASPQPLASQISGHSAEATSSQPLSRSKLAVTTLTEWCCARGAVELARPLHIFKIPCLATELHRPKFSSLTRKIAY